MYIGSLIENYNEYKYACEALNQYIYNGDMTLLEAYSEGNIPCMALSESDVNFYTIYNKFKNSFLKNRNLVNQLNDIDLDDDDNDDRYKTYISSAKKILDAYKNDGLIDEDKIKFIRDSESILQDDKRKAKFYGKLFGSESNFLTKRGIDIALSDSVKKPEYDDYKKFQKDHINEIAKERTSLDEYKPSIMRAVRSYHDSYDEMNNAKKLVGSLGFGFGKKFESKSPEEQAKFVDEQLKNAGFSIEDPEPHKSSTSTTPPSKPEQQAQSISSVVKKEEPPKTEQSKSSVPTPPSSKPEQQSQSIVQTVKKEALPKSFTPTTQHSSSTQQLNFDKLYDNIKNGMKKNKNLNDELDDIDLDDDDDENRYSHFLNVSRKMIENYKNSGVIDNAQLQLIKDSESEIADEKKKVKFYSKLLVGKDQNFASSRRTLDTLQDYIEFDKYKKIQNDHKDIADKETTDTPLIMMQRMHTLGLHDDLDDENIKNKIREFAAFDGTFFPKDFHNKSPEEKQRLIKERFKEKGITFDSKPEQQAQSIAQTVKKEEPPKTEQPIPSVPSTPPSPQPKPSTPPPSKPEQQAQSISNVVNKEEPHKLEQPIPSTPPQPKPSTPSPSKPEQQAQSIAQTVKEEPPKPVEQKTEQSKLSTPTPSPSKPEQQAQSISNVVNKEEPPKKQEALTVEEKKESLQKVQNTTKKILNTSEDKPKSVLARMISALQHLYRKWLDKKNQAKANGEDVGFFSNILRVILNCIDKLMWKIRNWSDGRKSNHYNSK